MNLRRQLRAIQGRRDSVADVKELGVPGSPSFLVSSGTNNVAPGYSAGIAFGDTVPEDTVQLTVQAAATQTSNLFEIQDSTGSVLSYFDADGKFHVVAEEEQDEDTYCAYCGQTETSKYDACVGCGHGGKDA